MTASIKMRDAGPPISLPLPPYMPKASKTASPPTSSSPPTLGEMTNRFEAITSQGYPYIVAEEAGRILGYAYASAFRTRPAYRWLVEDSIYLPPEARGKGSRPRSARRTRAPLHRTGFPADAGRHRRRPSGLGGSPPGGRLHRMRPDGRDRLQARALARYGPDADRRWAAAQPRIRIRTAIPEPCSAA